MKSLLCLMFLVLPAKMLLAQTHHSTRKKPAKVQTGTASYYANKFQGKRTYSGELYDKDKMTCASNTLAMGTWIKVTNLRNRRSVNVRVNDKLHPKNHRLVDLSRAAAAKLGYLSRGLAHVKVEVLGRKPPPAGH